MKVTHIITAIVMLSAITAAAQTAADSVGIYAYHGNELVKMRTTPYSRIKGSGALGYAFTMGLSGIRTKLEFRGASSPHVYTTPTAKFRFFFGVSNNPQTMVRDWMFLQGYGLNDFEVAKFIKKKNKRQLTNMTVSILGSSTGVAGADVQVKTTEIKKNVYEVEVTAEPGEYCFMFVGQGGGMGAGLGVYDFTIVDPNAGEAEADNP